MPDLSRCYCNPLNLPYRFQFPDRAKELFREAADPSVVVFADRYWLFASKSGGYWYSTDLLDWTFVKTTLLPTEDYAPDVRVIGGWLYFTASRQDEACPIFRTQHPELDQWERVSEPFAYWDPNLFEDEDGQVYLYWGCSNKVPIQGVMMDARTMHPIGEPVPVIAGLPERHGWERCGENHSTDAKPFIEGPWMTKHQGKYYLQYAGPGTEWNVYADGVYVSDSPLGPFTYADNNPYSYKPGGFCPGAGHGSTFTDFHGNLWHISTMRISIKHAFERRLGLFPAGFDEDGELYCNTRFADYPTRVADGKWDPWQDPFAGSMLLSFNKPVNTSSSLPGHDAKFAVDENIQTYWSTDVDDNDPWLSVNLLEDCDIHAIQINFAEQDCQWDVIKKSPMTHRYVLEVFNDGTWMTVCDKRENTRDVPHDFVTMQTPTRARHIRIRCAHMPAGGKFAISGLRVFGMSQAQRPEAVKHVNVTRENTGMQAQITWQADPSATGYNIQWGHAPHKLYHSFMVYDQNDLELRALDQDKCYWLRIDAFNEGGVTEGVVLEMK